MIYSKYLHINEINDNDSIEIKIKKLKNRIADMRTEIVIYNIEIRELENQLEDNKNDSDDEVGEMAKEILKL